MNIDLNLNLNATLDADLDDAISTADEEVSVIRSFQTFCITAKP